MSNLLDKASIILTPTAYNNGEALCVKPSDGSGDFDFSRNSAATRVNAQGLVENVQILSSNLVQNGDFSEEGAEEVSNGSFTNGSTDWSLGTGWSIGEDKAICDGNAGHTTLTQINSFLLGKTYKVTFDIVVDSGNFKIQLLGSGNDSGNIISSTQVGYTEYISPTANRSSFAIRSNDGSGIGSITNISVKEVGQNWSFGGDWELVNGTAEIQSATTSYLSQVNVVDLSVKNYRLQYEVVTTNGSNFRITGGSSAFGTVILDSATIGVKTIDLTSNGTQHRLIFTQSAFIGSIDNISLIEITDDTNLPRINYEGFSYDGSGNVVPDSGCGSWLWESQSTNLITYSETLGNNTTSGGISFTYNNSISPDGTQNAALVSVTSANDRLQPSFAAVNSLVAISIFLKHNGTDFSTQINTFNTGTGTLFGARAHVTATDVTFTSYSGGFDSASFVDYGNGWFRVIVVCQSTTGTTFVQWRPTSVNATLSYPCFGFQVEVQDFATSYIPTSGSTVTRNQDLCINGGSLASINSTEGVLYAEIARSEEENLYRLLGIDDGTSNNFVKMGFETSRGAFWIRAVINGVTSIFSDNALTSNPNEFYKIAIRYQSGNSAIYINGTSVLTTTTTFSSGNFTALDFNHFNNSFPFFGKTKCVAVWKEALSDAELTELTTI